LRGGISEGVRLENGIDSNRLTASLLFALTTGVVASSWIGATGVSEEERAVRCTAGGSVLLFGVGACVG
jgi:hypothetical protein